MPFEKLARTPAYHQVAEQIHTAISSGELRPGDVLPTERDLATQFGVSRTTIREALRSLQARGVVRGGQTAPLRTVVSHPTDVLEHSFDTVIHDEQVRPADVVDVRSCLEAGAIERGVLGASVQWDDAADALGRMGRMADARDAREPADLDELVAAYFDFHLAVVASSGSRLMPMTMRALQCALQDVVVQGLRPTLEDPARREDLGRLVDEHTAILDALRAGDGERAKMLVKEHEYGFFFGVFYGDGALMEVVRRELGTDADDAPRGMQAAGPVGPQ